MSKLSQDTIRDILSRLPAKSVCRFRCVSKTWLHLTHEPHFIATHLSRHQKQKLILSFNKSLFSLDQEAPIDDDMLPSELDYPLKGDPNNLWIRLLGSCNGLVCIMPQPEAFFVFNRSTRESMRVPDCPPSLAVPPQEVGYHVHGFGYAPSVKDYMFVKIAYGCSVLIFSLKNKSWKRVQDFPFKNLLNDPGTPLNGVVHWFCNGLGDHVPVIAAFDLAEEKFSGLPPPESIRDSQRCIPGVLRGSLCLLHHNDHNRRVFWIMKEYGVKESWTKILIAEPYFSLQPLCYWKNSKILVARNRREMLLYNPRDGTCKSLLANGLRSQRSLKIIVFLPFLGTGEQQQFSLVLVFDFLFLSGFVDSLSTESVFIFVINKLCFFSKKKKMVSRVNSMWMCMWRVLSRQTFGRTN